MAPTWKQLDFMYLVLLFKLEGLFNFVFLQVSEEKGEGAIYSPSAKENPSASLRGPPPEAAASQGGGEGPPGSWHTPTQHLLPVGGLACKASG